MAEPIPTGVAMSSVITMMYSVLTIFPAIPTVLFSVLVTVVRNLQFTLPIPFTKTYAKIPTRSRTVKAVRLYVTLGGPTCWIDTEEHAVICHWGTDQAKYAIDWDLCDELEYIVAECMELDR